MYPALYYTHNVQFESAAAMFAGSFAEARAAAQKTVTLADPFADQMVMVEPFVAQELIVLVRFGDWAPILQAKPPAPARVVQTALHHFARGAALAATGKAADAEAVFRADLDKHVGNPRSLYGLWCSLEAQRKPATDVKAQFDKAWAAADVALDDTLYPARR